MHRRWRQIRCKELVELVVQRPLPLHDGEVLSDPRKITVPVRVAETLAELGCELRDICAEHGNDTACEQGVDDLLEMILRTRCGPWHEAGLLPEDRAVELLQTRT